VLESRHIVKDVVHMFITDQTGELVSEVPGNSSSGSDPPHEIHLHVGSTLAHRASIDIIFSLRPKKSPA
jgi:hypothetical protein